MRQAMAAGLAALAVASLTTIVGVTPAHAEVPSGCPKATATNIGGYSNWDAVDATTPDRAGSSISVGPDPLVTHAGYDMDGDSVPDDVSVAEGTLTIERGDGTVTVTGMPAGISFDTSVVADVDADGGDELWSTGAGGPPPDFMGETILIPSSLAPGEHTLAAAGLRWRGHVVGDISGDLLPDAINQGQQVGGTIAMWQANTYFSLADRLDDGAARTIAERGDVDLDDKLDLVLLSPLRIVLSTSGEEIALPTTSFPYTAAHVVRAGTTTYVRASVLPFSPEYGIEVWALKTSCATPWMRALTTLVLHRLPVATDYGSVAPGSDPSRAVRLAKARAVIRSNEARRRLIEDRYEYFLGRAPDRSGAAYWFGALTTGRKTSDQLSASLFGSAEAVRKAGGVEAWVIAAYPKVFDRTGDPGGIAYWTRQARALGTERTAARMLASNESRRTFIRAFANAVPALGGNPSPAQLDRLLIAWAAGGYEGFLADLMASDEVYNRSQRNYG